MNGALIRTRMQAFAIFPRRTLLAIVSEWKFIKRKSEMGIPWLFNLRKGNAVDSMNMISMCSSRMLLA